MTRLFALLSLGSLLAAPALAGKHLERHERAAPFEVHMPFAGGVRLGIGVTPITDELRAHFGADTGEGVLVSQVFEGTAAAAAGIAVGDLIIALDGEAISNGMVLRAAVGAAAGKKVPVEVIRDGELKTLKAEIPDGPVHRESMQEFELPGGHGRAFVFESEDGDVQVDVDGMRDLMEHSLGEHGPFSVAMPVQSAELDELYQRIDELEQRLIEMSEKLDQSADRFEERLDALDR